MHVLILGAGPGGLTLAQCLRKRGISFEIFDRDEDANARFQGWALGLHTINEELLRSIPSDMPDLRRSTDHLMPLTLRGQIAAYSTGADSRIGFEDTPEKPMIRVERFRLREWLRTNIDIQWNKHAARFDHNDSGVSIDFADGTCSKGDILVGADGTNSRVREYLLGRPNHELLMTIPYAIIVGQVTLSGEDFRQQLELGHSGYNLMSSKKDFVSFNGLHKVLPDGLSGRYFWIFMQPDAGIDKTDHWLQNASQQDKLDHVLKTVAPLKPQFRRLFELTSIDGIKEDGHFFRDLELKPNQLPSGRVVLMGDAAHCMAPFRGEGGYHAMIDGLQLANVLGRLKDEKSLFDIRTVKAMVTEYNAEMITRSSIAVRNSRNGNKELMDRITGLTLLLKWVPWLLTLLLRMGPQTQFRVRYIPAERVMLPGDAPRPKTRKASSWVLLALSTVFLAYVVTLWDTSSIYH